MIYLVPIEPYEQRYTAQWYRWIPDALWCLDAEHTIVDGEQLTKTIDSGEVLDAYGTNVYKASQLVKLCTMARHFTDDDRILIMDGWFPGIEMLQYIRAITGKKFKIYSIWHAGCYDKHDFTNRYHFQGWAEDLENSWLNIYDGIFVGSRWHKELLSTKREVNPDKIHVTGLPFDYKEVRTQALYQSPSVRKYDVVFPHRLDDEKQPYKLDYLDIKDISIVKTVEKCKTKTEYYKMLASSKIALSFALQETFGFAMLESMALGCHPIVPDRLSYQDTIPVSYRYKEDEDVDGLIKRYLQEPEPDFSKWLDEWMPEIVVGRWLRLMEL